MKSKTEPNTVEKANLLSELFKEPLRKKDAIAKLKPLFLNHELYDNIEHNDYYQPEDDVRHEVFVELGSAARDARWNKKWQPEAINICKNIVQKYEKDEDTSRAKRFAEFRIALTNISRQYGISLQAIGGVIFYDPEGSYCKQIRYTDDPTSGDIYPLD